jgi:hypothetical protein
MVGLHQTITKEGQSYNSNWKFSPNAARETSSAIATVATAAAAQCVLHHKKQGHASAHPQLFLDLVASLQQNVGLQ